MWCSDCPPIVHQRCQSEQFRIVDPLTLSVREARKARARPEEPAEARIAKDAGPEVGARMPSIGGIAIRVLNRGLRPFLSKWHPMLVAWEATRRPDVSSLDHERGWTHAKELRAELGRMRKSLAVYAHA